MAGEKSYGVCLNLFFPSYAAYYGSWEGEQIPLPLTVGVELRKGSSERALLI